MEYRCNLCGVKIAVLDTAGPGINTDLVCPKCADEIQDSLRDAREIEQLLHKHLASTH